MMLHLIEKAVLSMALLRLLSGSIEIMAAMMMIKLNQIDKALVVNSILALVGPLILLGTTTIGLVGMADRLSVGKMLWIGIGVVCILIGVKR